MPAQDLLAAGTAHLADDRICAPSTADHAIALDTMEDLACPGVEGRSVPPRCGVMFASKVPQLRRGPRQSQEVPTCLTVFVGSVLTWHARQSMIAVFDQATGEVQTRRVVGRPHELVSLLGEVPRPARIVYEAGPTGYGLARRALAEGLQIAVCAPGKTERSPHDQIKTDKRDAIRLARLLAAGELTLVTVPSIEREQLRDLVRCREDIRVDLMRARHRIGKFLLRREIYWEQPGEAWSRKHRTWLTRVQFADQASRATLADYLHAHDVLLANAKRNQVEAAELREARAERAMRGGRVARPQMPAGHRHPHRARAVRRDRRMGAVRSPRSALRSYLRRLVPSEHTTESTTPALGVDYQGRRFHARPQAARHRAAHHYRRAPVVGAPLDASPTRTGTGDHQHLSWKAQRRLNARWHQLRKTPAANSGGVVGRRCRPRARRLPLGDRYLPTEPNPHSAPATPGDTHTPEACLTNSR